MGVTAPSLYTAFGDKKRLFLESARRYAGDPEALTQAINQAPSAFDVTCRPLTNAAVAFTGDTTPKGCQRGGQRLSGRDRRSRCDRRYPEVDRRSAAHAHRV